MEEIKKFLDEIISKYNPSNKDELLNWVQEEVSKLPNLKQYTNKMILCRGTILHLSINIEEICDAILSIYKKEELITATFNKKIGYVKNIIHKLDKDKIKFNKDFFKKMDRLVEIRDLYAHVPINLFYNELKFKESGPHAQWKNRIKNKSIIELNKEFISINNELISKLEGVLNLLKS